MPIISPSVAKKITPNRTKTTDECESKKAKSIRLTRKVQQIKDDSLKVMETTKLVQQEENQPNEEKTAVRSTLLSENQQNLSFSFRLMKNLLQIVLNLFYQVNLQLMHVMIKVNH